MKGIMGGVCGVLSRGLESNGDNGMWGCIRLEFGELGLNNIISGWCKGCIRP